MACGTFCCVDVCLCLCLSLYGSEVPVGYGEVTGRHGSKVCLAVREGRCVAGGAYGWNGCCRPGKVKLLVGMKSEQRMWGKKEPLEERKRMGASSEVRIVMQVFQVAM